MGERRNRLKSNLLTASLTFAIPLCVLSGLVSHDLSSDIEIAESELLGVAYLERLGTLLSHYADPRSEGSAAEQNEIASEVDAAFDALLRVDAASAERLQTTPAALALHGLEHFHVAHLREEWIERQTKRAHHVDHLLEDTRTLMRHVSNSSGLSLDPELDSYYLMSLSTNTLPDALARMHYLGEFSRFEEPLDRKLRERLKMFSWLFAGDLERIAYDASVAMDPLSAVRVDSGSIATALKEPSEALQRSGRTLRKAARELRATRGRDEDEKVAYVVAVDATMRAIRTLAERSHRELERLLEARIASQQRARAFALLLALGSFAASAALLRRVFRDVRGQLEDAGRVAREIGAGNLAVVVDVDAAVETRQLMTHLDATASELSSMVQQAVALVERVAAATQEMASRSLDIDARLQRQDSAVEQSIEAVRHVAQNAARISALSAKLSETTDASSDTAGTLAAGAAQMSESAESLFGNVSEVSAALQQQAEGLRRVVESAEAVHDASERTSGHMAQLEERVANTERAAHGSSELAQRSQQVAESGQSAVARTLEGMQSIEATSLELEANLDRLAARSKAIGQVTTMIDLIADDTRLLALNAAVIAAQSGGQSRAFGVVAGEIKALSKRVLERTREIEELVRSLQEESNAAQGVLARSRESVAKGMSRTTETRATFETIAGAARESSAQAATIAAAVEEQRAVVSAVAQQMASVREGVATIRAASADQHGSNQLVVSNARRVHDVSEQLQTAAQQQAKGAAEVQQSVARIRTAVASIDASLDEQTDGCELAQQRIAEASASAQATRADVAAMNARVQALVREADQLRAHIQRFTLRRGDGTAR